MRRDRARRVLPEPPQLCISDVRCPSKASMSAAGVGSFPVDRGRRPLKSIDASATDQLVRGGTKIRLHLKSAGRHAGTELASSKPALRNDIVKERKGSTHADPVHHGREP